MLKFRVWIPIVIILLAVAILGMLWRAAQELPALPPLPPRVLLPEDILERNARSKAMDAEFYEIISMPRETEVEKQAVEARLKVLRAKIAVFREESIEINRGLLKNGQILEERLRIRKLRRPQQQKSKRLVAYVLVVFIGITGVLYLNHIKTQTQKRYLLVALGSLVLVVFIGITGVLYLHHIKTQTQRDIANPEMGASRIVSRLLITVVTQNSNHLKLRIKGP